MNEIVLKTYNINDLILGEGHTKRVYVPPGYLSQFPDGAYVSSIWLGRYLDWEGKTIQDYYDRWILNITVRSDRPKCPNCGKELPFGRNLGEGYRYEFCSLKCKANYALEHPDEYPEYFNSFLQYKSTDRTFYDFQIYKDYKRALSGIGYYELKDMYFYVIISTKFIKIGISMNEGAYDRISRNTPIEDRTSRFISYIGEPEAICECEYKIKQLSYEFIYDFQDSGWTERFTPDVLPIVRKVLSSYDFQIFDQYISSTTIPQGSTLK